MDKQDETSVDKLARLRADSDQRRVPSDPDRDTSGDSVYTPHPSDTIHGDLDLGEPEGPDAPTIINGYQTVQVMPLSQYDSEKDLLIINVSVGKLRPDRAKAQIQFTRDEMNPWLKDLGWKHVMYVPVSFEHPMHRQFRTVNVMDLHGLSNTERKAVFDKMRKEMGPIGGPDANHISAHDYLGDLPGAISDEE